MLNTQGHKLPQSLLKSPVRQSNSFSSTPDLEDGASSPTSRKRKRADIDGEIQLGDPFFVRVCYRYCLVKDVMTDCQLADTPVAPISKVTITCA